LSCLAAEMLIAGTPRGADLANFNTCQSIRRHPTCLLDFGPTGASSTLPSERPIMGLRSTRRMLR
jgi:hypothetical protein